MTEVPSKLQEKLKGKEGSFDGKHFVCEGKKYNKEGLKVIAENISILFNCAELKINEVKKE